MIKIDNIIAKKNGTFFGEKNPFIHVRSINSTHIKGMLMLNEKFKIEIDNINVITPQHASELKKIYQSLIISEHEPKDGTDPCVSSVSGEKKLKFSTKTVTWKKSLFHSIVKYNNPNFQAYICPTCKYIHIGKNE